MSFYELEITFGFAGIEGQAHIIIIHISYRRIAFFVTGLVINRFSLFKKEGISTQVDRNPDNGGNSKIGLFDIQID
jgi:hypothetical protein